MFLKIPGWQVIDSFEVISARQLFISEKRVRPFLVVNLRRL